MADRALLHRSALEDFRRWLWVEGWYIDAPKVMPEYQALRAWRLDKNGSKRWLIVYDRNRGDHLSLLQKDAGFAKAFIAARRRALEQST